MRKSQADRRIIAARLGPNTGATPSTGHGTTGTNPALRTTAVAGSGFVTRRNRSGATRGQRRDSTGGSAGAWNRSASGEMRRTGDSRWAQTVGFQWVGGAR